MALTVSALHIYPVKGLKGIALEAARCTERGLEHDRRWMVVDRSGTFISQRSHPKMATVWTEIEDDHIVLSAPDVESVALPLEQEAPATLSVTVWNSLCAAVAGPKESDDWLSDYLGEPCRFVYMPHSTRRHSNPEYAGHDKLVGFADGYAYLVISEGSLADLNAKLAAKGHPALPMNRFRPSLVIAGSEPYAEDGWKRIRIGEAVLQAAKPCGRCQVTTTDQATGEVRGPEPLATLATYRESSEFGVMFGMNFVTANAGDISVGQGVRIE
ncbi:MAG TPA: MOSC N-terminal beta barrel domain-containing protein [Usitatibacter sp.]|nr:MOSC N-terminal beta barrel domain-containing protein [Usitatibacter sp.]